MSDRLPDNRLSDVTAQAQRGPQGTIRSKGRVLAFLDEHRTGNIIGIIAVVISIVGILFSQNLNTNDAVSTASPTSESAEIIHDVPGRTRPADSDVLHSSDVNAAPTAQSGACLDADGAPVDCAAEHVSQVFSTDSACTLNALRDFLGGSKVDVLRPDLQIMQQPGGTACLVTLQDSALITGSLEGVFTDHQNRTADQVRFCLDVDGQPISCRVPHHGEVVSITDDSAKCYAMAGSYLGRSSNRVPPGLSLGYTTGSPGRCNVTVKGENILTATVRGIGQHAVPIAPAG